MQIKAEWKSGRVTVRPESGDDLWLLSQIIQAGDLLRGKTTRKIKLSGNDAKTQVKKATITLTIKVKQAEWTGETLRVTGEVEEEMQDIAKGSTHTITVEPMQECRLSKNTWPNFLKKRLEEGAEKQQTIILCLFEREEGRIALLKKSGVKELVHVTGSAPKKRIDSATKNTFYKELGKKLEEINERFKPQIIVLASPAFWKDELLKDWKGEKIGKKIIFATVSGATKSAFAELIKRPELKEALASAQVAKEAAAIEKLFTAIAKNKPVAYGIKEVKKATEQGAVAELMITQDHITKAKQEEKFHDVEKLLTTIDSASGQIHIIAGKHEAARRLNGLGGIAALLRFNTE